MRGTLDASQRLWLLSVGRRVLQGMEELEEERLAHRHEIDGARESSREIAMLDAKVT